MCNNISTALKYVAASDNTYVTLAAFSVPVVNSLSENLKKIMCFKRL